MLARRSNLECLPCIALCVQAGGGGSFDGGGGGGGGGSGDGDLGGLIELIFWVLRLTFEYPKVGVPLLVGGVLFALIGVRLGWWKHQESTIRRARPERRVRASRAWAETLRASDPAFHETRFLERAQLAFQRAQDGWCAQDLEPLRPFVSDGVFERFSLQIEEQRSDGWRQGMLLAGVGPLAIVHARPGRHFETVTVRTPFRADIHRLSLTTGKRMRGSQLARESFSECWSFVRRSGAKTIAGEGLIEGKCPNCRAALRMNQSARCEHCQCLARSGQFDWVLTEITQTSEWSAADEREIPGLARILERDAGMNVQMLEDRASVAFWRQSAADRRGRVDPLTRIAAEDLCRRQAAEFAALPSGERSWTADRAVGSVRTLGLLPGPERERAMVEIVWDGRRAVLEADGKSRLEPTRELRRTLFVFARRTGAETRLEEAFTTAHCRTCGAHDTGGTDAACPYCGSPRVGNESEWMLTDVLEAGTSAARGLRAELARSGREISPTPPTDATGRSPAELVHWAVALAHADGVLVDSERRAIHALAVRAEMPVERADELLRTPGESEFVARPRNVHEARTWLHQLTRIALADGSLSRGERRLLYHAAVGVGLGRPGFQHELANARTALYRESRVAKRGLAADGHGTAVSTTEPR